MNAGISRSPSPSERKTTNPDKRIIALLFGVTAIFVALTCARAWHKPFWYDEIFTLAVADQPDFAHMWKAYWAGFEYNPPLIYLATRFSQDFGNPSELFARLPSMFGYVVMMISVAIFVARRLPFMFVLAALSFPLVSEAYDYSYEARPYGMLLGFAGIALIGWQSAADDRSSPRRRRLGLLLLFIGLSGALLCHCYAVLLYIPIGAGELWRILDRRRVDITMLAVLAVSLAPIAIYPPLLAASHKVVMGGIFVPTARRFLGAYAILVRRALVPLTTLCAPLLVIALLHRKQAGRAAHRLLELVPAYELTVVIAVTLIPACGFLGARILQSQYITRYGLAANLGISILLAYATYILGAEQRRWAGWMIAVASVWFVASFIMDARQWPSEPSSGNNNQANIVAAASTGLPVVISEGRAFLAFAYYLQPESARHLVYAADPSDAARLTGSNLVDVALLLARPWLPVPAKVQGYSDFVSHNKDFLLFAPNEHPLEWISRQLLLDGATFESAGKPYLYQVRMDRAPASHR